MLKILQILFMLCSSLLLRAQDPVLRTAESLLNNVVQISVSFSDGSKQDGFGFITGEKNGQLYLATAAHILYGEAFDLRPNLIQVQFYREFRVYTADVLTFFKAQDVALLQMSKPPALEYKSDNWADFFPQNYQSVRFIGRDREWLIPGQGEVYKIENDRIVASMSTIRPGISGAPLINSNGIIGLITEDNNLIVTAITLRKIYELFTQDGRFPYFFLYRNNNQYTPLSLFEKDLIAHNMVKIEGGSFTMGCIESRDGLCESNETPSLQVAITSFYLSKYEVTVAQFKSFIDQTNYQTDADKKGYSYVWTGSTSEKKYGVNWRFDVVGNLRDLSDYQHPVIHVSHIDAIAYCSWLSKQTGKTYRLPTESEWEYAARGGKLTKGYMYAGSNEIKEVAWYDENSNNTTHKVGGLKPNELGLYDMNGNIYEWCADWYNEKYFKPTLQINPQSSYQDLLAVLRGGSWKQSGSLSRVSSRHKGFPEDCNFNVGFRVARKL